LCLLLSAFCLPTAASTVNVHVTVALCDNASQGIVPVPAAIGDGNDPRTNLYWGASLGVKSWLKREGWKIEKATPPNPAILERIIAKKRIASHDVVITADAWRGNRIRDAITSFLERSASGSEDVVAYVGHDGLMEFTVAPRATRSAKPPRSIVLACASRQYFEPLLRAAGSKPLLLTTGLMAPEAYTLTAAIEAWVTSGDEAQVREAAARAYDRHQHCGLRGARRLFAER
ncbi:MAG TPA: hypothetical protein VMU84_00880, partial [Thermoanaerobaculia bacterium]|nr:hypothetical protein [Thermoanaerobaculia bacterium]